MTPTISRLALAALALSASILTAQPALAAVACGSGNFDAWLADFKADATAKGGYSAGGPGGRPLFRGRAAGEVEWRE